VTQGSLGRILVSRFGRNRVSGGFRLEQGRGLGKQELQAGPDHQRLGHACGTGLALCMRVGRGRRRVGPAVEKMAHNDFFHFKSFSN
jgi:hypothetical protein